MSWHSIFWECFFFSLPAPKHVSCWRSFPNTSKLENAMSQVSTRKNPAKKMRRRKLQKNATQKVQRWKLPFFAFSVAFVLAPLYFVFHFYVFFA
jgi:hypothetical protein